MYTIDCRGKPLPETGRAIIDYFNALDAAAKRLLGEAGRRPEKKGGVTETGE